MKGGNDYALIKEELNKSREELLLIIIDLRRQLLECQRYQAENSAALTAMSKDYLKQKEQAEALREENRQLKSVLVQLAEKEQLKAHALYGCGSENLTVAFSSPQGLEEVDEAAAEEETATPGNHRDCPAFCRKEKKNNGNPKQPRKKKTPLDLSALPRQTRFLLDFDSLDQQYGEGNWRITHWHKHTSVEYKKAAVCAVDYYSPVVSVGLEHEMVTIPYECLLKGSYVTASLLAEILYLKFFLSIPLYRQESHFAGMGLALSRQTMSNWVHRFAFDFFSLVTDRLQEVMMGIPYHQCDETTIRVNRDGRKAGTRSYMWVHITSELCDAHPIVLFCYELTRGTDHLRKFYEDFRGFITSDAYCSYLILGKEKQDAIIICGCMMHMRRRFYQSLLLVDKEGITDEALQSLPEVQALGMIQKIYDADEPLKTLSCEERKIQRDKAVRPLVERFFTYIESLGSGDSLMGNRLKDAVNYARNQKEYLCRFLDDGNIPIDDGATERRIRSFAIGRNNFLFCDSIDGAKATAILYSLVETAKANHADVYLYLRYLLEKMPAYMSGTDRTFVDKMLPWSGEYREYEKYHRSQTALIDEFPGYAERPKTPRKQKASRKQNGPGQIA